MSQLNPDQVTNAETGDLNWKSLYKVGGWGVMIALAFYLSQFLIIIFGEPYPITTEEWFLLFQRSKLLGLFYLNALDIVSITLFSLMFLALYVALKGINQSYMAIAALLAFLGIAIFIAPRSASLSIVQLSDQYAAATTEIQRAQILAVGDALVSLSQATPLTTGFLLIAVAVLIISIVLLRSRIFGKLIAYMGILASVFVFALQVSVIVLPVIADPLMGLAMIFWMLWLLLIGRKLLQLGRQENNTLPREPSSV